MWRSVASNALTLLIVALLAIGGVIAWGQRQYVTEGPLVEAICFRVEEGASLGAVSASLQQEGAITDARILRIGMDYAGLAGQLKFGSYLLEPGVSMQQVARVLTTAGQSSCGADVNLRIGVASSEVVLRTYDTEAKGLVETAKFDVAAPPPPEYLAAIEDPALRWRVTLVEGVTSWSVVEALKAAPFLKGEVAEVPPEGSLAPDSYEVARGADRAEILSRMAAAQVINLDAAWAARAEGLPYETKEEALIMASIVEKETGVADERPLVASVFVNRLREGMRLQTDPTVIYGVTEGRGVLGRGLRQSELRRETPWNTYVIQGLPPTPIANPGRASIEAALNPASSDYLYFVADGTGGHAFATNLDDHNANVAKWRAIEAAQEQD